MPRILVAGPIHPDGMAVLAAAPGVTVESIDGPGTGYVRGLAGADALLLRTQPLDATAIAMAPALGIVSRHGVGYDAVDVAALDARAIPLAVVGDVNSRTVAEHAMAMMLGAAKRLLAYDPAVRAGEWAIRETFSTSELYGKTLLIVGFGRIGRHLAGMAQAFGMRVLAHDPFIDAASPSVVLAPDLSAALETADYVSLHLPKALDRPLIGPEELARMKPTAMIVNTARGGLVDEDALAAALDSGRLGAAGIDVFADEPVADSPLIASRNAILTPHSAALTADCAARMAVSAAQNILDHFAGTLDPSLVVNAGAIGYRT